MHYFMIWLLLLPVTSQAMNIDIDTIKKYSLEKYQALSIKESLSEQEKKECILSWFTLSLIPFLQAKQENEQKLMKQRLDELVPTLNQYSTEKILLKLNPHIIVDDKGQYPIDLMNESINCGSMLCCAACITHNSYSNSQLQELRKQLGAIKRLAIEDSSLKNIDPVMTQLLLTMNKLPIISESDHATSGYGDSFG